jgi:hypothetical protein
MEAVARIGETLREILADASSRDVSPVEAARMLVIRRLEAARAKNMAAG